MLAGTRRISTRYDPRDVARTRKDAEVSPTEVGLRADAAEQIWRRVEGLYRTGTHPAIAVCIRHRGQPILDRVVGHARGNSPSDPRGGPRVLATPDTPFCLFSASKAVTAMVIHHLDDRGLVHVGDRVCDYIPEFARHGKEWVTLRHVLTHRAGIPAFGDERHIDMLRNPAEIVEILCDARPESLPGRRLAYHAITGGFLLGEIVRRVTGRDIRTYLHDEVLEPLGFRGMNYGWPADRLDEVAVNAFTGARPSFPVSLLARRALGVPWERAPEVANSATWLESIVPSGNIVATADEACRFFQLLLQEGELDGKRVFAARTVRRAITETAYLEMDFTLMIPIRYGVGFMLGGDRLGIFGPHTPRAFGHLGFTNIFCWADPARQLSAAVLTSGKPLVSRHILSLGGLLAAISRYVPPTSD